MILLEERIEWVAVAADLAAAAGWEAVVMEAIDLVDEITDLEVALADETTDPAVALVVQEADTAIEEETQGAILADEGHLTLATTDSPK